MTHRPDQSFRFQERSYSRCSTPMCQPNPVSPSSSEQKKWLVNFKSLHIHVYYIGYISNALCVIIASYSTTFYFLNKLTRITLLWWKFSENTSIITNFEYVTTVGTIQPLVQFKSAKFFLSKSKFKTANLVSMIQFGDFHKIN